MPYIKKEKDQPVEDEVPTSFAITLFHVVFMYPSNITVISKISREIVYFCNIDKTKLLRGISMDLKAHLLLAYGLKEKIQIANLKGEDQDAWKYFLKEKNINTAHAYARTPKQKEIVSAIYAEQLFNSGKYDKAADHFIQSGLSFETVCLKYLQNNQSLRLISYLLLVLRKLKKNDASSP